MPDVHFPLPVPPVKGERPGDTRQCTVTRTVLLIADKPWPPEFKRGFAFSGSYATSAAVPHGGRMVVSGQVMARSRDGLRLWIEP